MWLVGFEPAIRSDLISTSQLLRWQLGQLFYDDVHIFPWENRFKTDDLKNPVIVIYNQLPLYILLKVQIYGERENLLLTLNRLLRWLNRLSGNHPHPYSQKIGGRGKRNNNGVFLSPFLVLKKLSVMPLFHPEKGTISLFQLKMRDGRNRDFWNISSWLCLSTEVRRPLGCSFSQRFQLFIDGPQHRPPFCNCRGPFFKKGGPGLWTFSYFFVFKPVCCTTSQ